MHRAAYSGIELHTGRPYGPQAAPANGQERTAELDWPRSLSIDSISSFGLDAEEEIYIVDRGGEVFKIVLDGPAVSESHTEG